MRYWLSSQVPILIRLFPYVVTSSALTGLVAGALSMWSVGVHERIEKHLEVMEDRSPVLQVSPPAQHSS